MVLGIELTSAAFDTLNAKINSHLEVKINGYLGTEKYHNKDFKNGTKYLMILRDDWLDIIKECLTNAEKEKIKEYDPTDALWFDQGPEMDFPEIEEPPLI